MLCTASVHESCLQPIGHNPCHPLFMKIMNTSSLGVILDPSAHTHAFPPPNMRWNPRDDIAAIPTILRGPRQYVVLRGSPSLLGLRRNTRASTLDTSRQYIVPAAPAVSYLHHPTAGASRVRLGDFLIDHPPPPSPSIQALWCRLPPAIMSPPLHLTGEIDWVAGLD